MTNQSDKIRIHTDSNAPSVSSETTFKQSLGLLDGTMIVAGSMIGSGIFLVTSPMVRDVGSATWVLFLWLLTGIITIFGALSYGELAGMMPRAGGQFVYIQRAWGDLTAFLYGWSVFTVIQTGVIAAVAVAFANYTGVFFPLLKNICFAIGSFQVTWAQVVAIDLILFLTWVNAQGVQYGKIIQLIFTLAKIIALLGLIIIGLYVGLQKDTLFQNFASGWSAARTRITEGGGVSVEIITGWALILALGSAIVNPLFSSDTWNNVTFIAGEMKDPSRNIPRSLLLGTLIVTTLYILSNLAYFSLLPINGAPNGWDATTRGIQFAQNNRVGAAAAEVMFGDWGTYLMAALIMVSTFGCASGSILSGARIYYTMAQEKLFFHKAGQLNRNSVPSFALWAQAIWASVLCLSGTYNDLLDYLTFVSLVFYAVTVAGVYRLRQTEPNANRPYRVADILPIVYIVLASFISLVLLVEKTKNTGLGLLIVLLGVPFYFIAKKK